MRTLGDIVTLLKESHKNRRNMKRQTPNIVDINNDPERIYMSWHIDDVLDRAETLGYHVTKTEARDILQDLKDNHDATIGINWDTIDAAIEARKG